MFNSKAPEVLTASEYQELSRKRGSKYRNKKCSYDGKAFDSLKERNRYIELKAMQDAGLISKLKTQPIFQLSVCKYKGDFLYERDGETVVEDVKGFKTAVYRIKKKLMKKELGIRVIEI